MMVVYNYMDGLHGLIAVIKFMNNEIQAFET